MASLYRHRLKSRGFNLAETMAAMVVLTLALFAVIAVNTYTLRSTDANENQLVANTIAGSQLSLVESILKTDFRVPTESVSTEVFQSAQNPDFYFQITDLGFEDPDRLLRRVSVRVYWKEKGVTRDYELATTFYNY